MKEFKEELKALLTKYNAYINIEQDEDDSFLRLQIRIFEVGSEISEDIDTGYRDLMINQNNL